MRGRWVRFKRAEVVCVCVFSRARACVHLPCVCVRACARARERACTAANPPLPLLHPAPQLQRPGRRSPARAVEQRLRRRPPTSLYCAWLQRCCRHSRHLVRVQYFRIITNNYWDERKVINAQLHLFLTICNSSCQYTRTKIHFSNQDRLFLVIAFILILDVPVLSMAPEMLQTLKALSKRLRVQYLRII